jgi:hypothetical protein
MDLYSKLFDVPDCHPAKPERDIGNGNTEADHMNNYQTMKDQVER